MPANAPASLRLEGTSARDPLLHAHVYRGSVTALLRLPPGACALGWSVATRVARSAPGEGEPRFPSVHELPPAAARRLGADRAWVARAANRRTCEVALEILLQGPGGGAPAAVRASWLQAL